MSVTEILDELPKLNPEERHLLLERLTELEIDSMEETPEMLAALDAALGCRNQGKGPTIDEVRGLIAQWTTKSR